MDWNGYVCTVYPASYPQQEMDQKSVPWKVHGFAGYADGSRSAGPDLHAGFPDQRDHPLGLHLGFHWNMMMGMAGKMAKTSSGARKWALRAIAAFLVGYGVYAFKKREIGSYMFLKSHFVFFDFEEPVVLYLFDYMAAAAVFVCAGHYFGAFLRGSFHQDRRNQVRKR